MNVREKVTIGPVEIAIPIPLRELRHILLKAGLHGHCVYHGEKVYCYYYDPDTAKMYKIHLKIRGEMVWKVEKVAVEGMDG